MGGVGVNGVNKKGVVALRPHSGGVTKGVRERVNLG